MISLSIPKTRPNLITSAHNNGLILNERSNIMELSEMHPMKQYFNLGEGCNAGGCGCGGWGGGNNLFTILLLFFLFGSGNFGGWGGGWGARNGAFAADSAANTAASVAKNEAGLDYLGNAMSMQGVKLDGITAALSQNTAAIQSSLCQGFNGINTQILESKYDITKSIDNCCCTTQRSIDAVAAAIDRSTCAIINSGKDNTQAILTALSDFRNDQDRRKICELEQKLNASYIISQLKNA